MDHFVVDQMKIDKLIEEARQTLNGISYLVQDEGRKRSVDPIVMLDDGRQVSASFAALVFSEIHES